jgi:hypothetical protein
VVVNIEFVGATAWIFGTVPCSPFVQGIRTFA